MNKISSLEKNLGIEFQKKELLEQAFTHRSYLNEHPEFPLEHNERLEFLGDAVLELVVTEHLFRNFSNPEGELTAWRAALVNSEMLSSIATSLNFNDYLRLSKGEAKDTGRARQTILANTMEAVIGAIYLDQGFEAARRFVERTILPNLPKIIAEQLYQDAKSRFQEIAQEKLGITPHYEVLAEWGPDHDKHFRIGVFVGKERVAEGEGPSKQRAEMDAAKAALIKKGWQ